MTSPPCQAFSLAGKRLGKDDKRGILFFNSYEFIQKNNPRFFIFENVKGLLSDDGGNTFSEWVNLLAGKSINGLPILFPYDNALPYHLYWQVLNAKHHGVPQNRERVFLIGIRDDKDNNFRFPVEEHLSKRLKDVLEEEVDDKYFLSEKFMNFVLTTKFQEAKPIDINRDEAPCVKVGGDVSCFKVKLATSKGHEEALDTERNKGVICGAIRGRGDNNKATLELNSEDYSNAIITSQTANLIKLDFKIRRFTPRECFRLMDFPDTFTWTVSDSQAYKQAGNSIVVRVLEKIIKNLLQI
jgi:DNA (cytosine-5)-methyltransferase 1